MRTKIELIQLNPEEMLFKHAEKIKLPEFIVNEIWEQKNFFSKQKMINMCSWCYDQFIEWHNTSL
jgi:hypothetical protein